MENVFFGGSPSGRWFPLYIMENVLFEALTKGMVSMLLAQKWYFSKRTERILMSSVQLYAKIVNNRKGTNYNLVKSTSPLSFSYMPTLLYCEQHTAENPPVIRLRTYQYELDSKVIATTVTWARTHTGYIWRDNDRNATLLLTATPELKTSATKDAQLGNSESNKHKQ